MCYLNFTPNNEQERDPENMESKEIEKSKVICQGDWVIDKENNIAIECYVTKDKGRFLSLKGSARALGLSGAGSTALVRNLNRQWLEPYLSPGLKEWLKDISSEKIETLAGLKGRNIIPLEASLFVDICKAYINAQRAGLFTDKNGLLPRKWEKQNDIADKLYMIMAAFAKVGIIAFIDEITGYQEERDRDELSILLSLYLTEERLAWAKMFPDEFYKQIYRLKNWTYPTTNKTKRTPLLGKITNEIVYEKLPEGVLGELRKRNPVLPATKRRRWKFTSFLSYDLGQPDLRNHLLQVVALMRASANWSKFKRLFVRAFPSGPEQSEMGFMEDED